MERESYFKIHRIISLSFLSAGEAAMSHTKKEDELLDRNAAAKYLGGNKPLNPGTLAVWDCTKRYDLKPIKVGRSVRYLRSELDRFLQSQLQK